MLEVIGNGPGEGPGEFDYAGALAQVAENELLVLTGLPVVHKYSTGGDFLHSFRLPTGGGASFAVSHRGRVITEATTLNGTRGFLLEGDSIRALEIRGRSVARLLLAAAEDVGVWSAESDRFVLRRHTLPDGVAVDSLVVSRDWFPGPRDNQAHLYRIHADGRGLIWAVVNAADPDAPRGSLPAKDEEEIVDEEAYVANLVKTRDTVVEAFASDGRLVASVRFDSFSGIPLRGDLWYRPTEDMLSMIILEAVLIQRP